MVFSLGKNIGILRSQGFSSEILSLAAALSKGNVKQCRSSSTAPVPQETGNNLLGSDMEGKYSPFKVNLCIHEWVNFQCTTFGPQFACLSITLIYLTLHRWMAKIKQ